MQHMYTGLLVCTSYMFLMYMYLDMCSGVITVPRYLLCVADCAKRERGCTVLYTAFLKYNESAL